MKWLRLVIALAPFVPTTLAAGAEMTPGRQQQEQAVMSSIDTLRRETLQRDRFVLPGGKELGAARRAFADLVTGRGPAQETLHAAGLVSYAGVGFDALADAPEAPAGRGLYVMREGGAPLMISVPHQFKDLKTGRLGALVAEEQNARAAAFNTAPRDLSVGPEGRLSDLGKLDATHFNMFHLALYAAHPKTRIVQLHGYAREKRQTAAGRGTDVIVSNATRRLDPGTRAIVDCLQRAGFRAGLYPETVTELGGTKNATFAALLDAGAPVGTFVHVEISRELRDMLSDENQIRWVFGACLGSGL